MSRYTSSVDVARRAGVSQSTVSRVYQDSSKVSADTRDRVLAAAAELNYRPSIIPQIMLTSRSNLVAVVVGGLENPFYTDALQRFTNTLQTRGQQALLVQVGSSYSFDAAIPRLTSYRVDAIVSALPVLTAQTAIELAQFKVPVVSFNTSVQNKWLASISCDNFGGAKKIAELLLDKGATRFGYLSGPKGGSASQDRRDGYEGHLRENNVKHIAVEHGEFTYQDGFAAAMRMFSGASSPDALFCENDILAIGALDALKAIKVRVPEDVMVCGFDDNPIASWGSYDLTTAVQDTQTMVDHALAVLDESAWGPVNARTVVVPSPLIERGSTNR